MRTVSEIKADMDENEVSQDERSLANQAGLPIVKAALVIAAMEDDLGDHEKLALFKSCVGKTDEEIVQLAHDATTDFAEVHPSTAV